jgi:hypothetical protein
LLLLLLLLLLGQPVDVALSAFSSLFAAAAAVSSNSNRV